MKSTDNILREGGVILYPTEGVFGLGCDPFNETAVRRLLKIKGREISRGLLLIAATWKSVRPLMALDPKRYERLWLTSAPVTWVFPAAEQVPPWIRGDFNSVAIRVTHHHVAREICLNFSGPVVSTSANFTSLPPAMRLEDVDRRIVDAVDHIVAGEIGTLAKATPIYDVVTGKVIRS